MIRPHLWQGREKRKLLIWSQTLLLSCLIQIPFNLWPCSSVIPCLLNLILTIHEPCTCLIYSKRTFFFSTIAPFLISTKQKELTKRLQQTSGLLETFEILIRRVSLTMIGKNVIFHIINRIQKGNVNRDPSLHSSESEGINEIDWNERIGAAAENLLEVSEWRLTSRVVSFLTNDNSPPYYPSPFFTFPNSRWPWRAQDVSNVYPELYLRHLSELTRLLQSEDEELAGQGLQATAQLVRAFPNQATSDSATAERLISFALIGSPKQAKQAIIILSHRPDCSEICSKLIKVRKTPALPIHSSFFSKHSIPTFSPQLLPSNYRIRFRFSMKI